MAAAAASATDAPWRAGNTSGQGGNGQALTKKQKQQINRHKVELRGGSQGQVSWPVGGKPQHRVKTWYCRGPSSCGRENPYSTWKCIFCQRPFGKGGKEAKSSGQPLGRSGTEDGKSGASDSPPSTGNTAAAAGTPSAATPTTGIDLRAVSNKDLVALFRDRFKDSEEFAGISGNSLAALEAMPSSTAPPAPAPAPAPASGGPEPAPAPPAEEVPTPPLVVKHNNLVAANRRVKKYEAQVAKAATALEAASEKVEQAKKELEEAAERYRERQRFLAEARRDQQEAMLHTLRAPPPVVDDPALDLPLPSNAGISVAQSQQIMAVLPALLADPASIPPLGPEGITDQDRAVTVLAGLVQKYVDVRSRPAPAPPASPTPQNTEGGEADGAPAAAAAVAAAAASVEAAAAGSTVAAPVQQQDGERGVGQGGGSDQPVVADLQSRRTLSPDPADVPAAQSKRFCMGPSAPATPGGLDSLHWHRRRMAWADSQDDVPEAAMSAEAEEPENTASPAVDSEKES
jgi:hypothetical protein